jgi:hypothetical protein
MILILMVWLYCMADNLGITFGLLLLGLGKMLVVVAITAPAIKAIPVYPHRSSEMTTFASLAIYTLDITMGKVNKGYMSMTLCGTEKIVIIQAPAVPTTILRISPKPSTTSPTMTLN